MPQLIRQPVRIEAAGQPPKIIEEFIGRVSSQTAAVSIARMKSPPGWSEPAQTPQFDEYSIVLEGSLHAQVAEGVLVAGAGQALAIRAGERVQYSTPDGAEYLAVCLPAFSPATVHREAR